MEIRLIAGARNEQMIELVKSAIGYCQSEEHFARIMNNNGEICDVPHEVGSCRNCRRCSKTGCDLMELCREYGFGKVYDAVFYAYGGDSQILKDIEAFVWETMTQEDYRIYLEWLSTGNVMTT